jgi:AcrR family transcriptional regulator
MARPKDLELEQQRKERIMFETYRLLAQRSHVAVSVADVAAAAEVSKGLVHYYFGHKDGLILATIERFVALQESLLVAAAESKRPVAERLDDLMVVLLPDRAVLEERVRFVTEVWSYAKTSPAGADAVRRSFAALRAACARLVERGRAEGYVTVAADASLVFTLTAVADGFALQAVYDPEADLARLRELARGLVEKLLRPPA